MPVSPYLTQTTYTTRPYARTNSNTPTTPTKYFSGDSSPLPTHKTFGRSKIGEDVSSSKPPIYLPGRYKSSDIPESQTLLELRLKKSNSNSSLFSGNTANIIKNFGKTDDKKVSPYLPPRAEERKFCGKSGGVSIFANQYLAKVNRGKDYRPREIDTRDINTTIKPKVAPGFNSSNNGGAPLTRSSRHVVRLTIKREEPDDPFVVKDKTIKTIAQRLIEKYTDKEKIPDPYEYVPRKRLYEENNDTSVAIAATPSVSSPQVSASAPSETVSIPTKTSLVTSDSTTNDTQQDTTVPTLPPKKKSLADLRMTNTPQSSFDDEGGDAASRLLRATSMAVKKKELENSEEVKDAIIAAVLHPDVDIESDEEMKELVQGKKKPIDSWEGKEGEQNNESSGDYSDEGKTIVGQIKRFVQKQVSTKHPEKKKKSSKHRSSNRSRKGSKKSKLELECITSVPENEGVKVTSATSPKKKTASGDSSNLLSADLILGGDKLSKQKKSKDKSKKITDGENESGENHDPNKGNKKSSPSLLSPKLVFNNLTSDEENDSHSKAPMLEEKVGDTTKGITCDKTKDDNKIEEKNETKIQDQLDKAEKEKSKEKTEKPISKIPKLKKKVKKASGIEEATEVLPEIKVSPSDTPPKRPPEDEEKVADFKELREFDTLSGINKKISSKTSSTGKGTEETSDHQPESTSHIGPKNSILGKEIKSVTSEKSSPDNKKGKLSKEKSISDASAELKTTKTPEKGETPKDKKDGNVVKPKMTKEKEITPLDSLTSHLITKEKGKEDKDAKDQVKDGKLEETLIAGLKNRKSEDKKGEIVATNDIEEDSTSPPQVESSHDAVCAPNILLKKISSKKLLTNLSKKEYQQTKEENYEIENNEGSKIETLFAKKSDKENKSGVENKKISSKKLLTDSLTKEGKQSTKREPIDKHDASEVTTLPISPTEEENKAGEYEKDHGREKINSKTSSVSLSKNKGKQSIKAEQKDNSVESEKPILLCSPKEEIEKKEEPAVEDTLTAVGNKAENMLEEKADKQVEVAADALTGKKAIKRPRQIGIPPPQENAIGTSDLLNARKILKRPVKKIEPGTPTEEKSSQPSTPDDPNKKLWKRPLPQLVPPKDGDQFLQARNVLKKPVKTKVLPEEKTDKPTGKLPEMKVVKKWRKPGTAPPAQEQKEENKEVKQRSRSPSSSDEEDEGGIKKAERQKRPLKPRQSGEKKKTPSPKQSPSSTNDLKGSGKDPKLSACQSADSGYGSSPSTPQPTQTTTPDVKSEEETCTVCGTNCHKKCEKQMANLCGVNQKLLAEALSSVKKAGSADGTSRTLASPTKSSSVSASETETTEDESETDTDTDYWGLPEIRPPLQTRPKFKRYTIDDFLFVKVLGKGSYGKVMLAQQKDTENYFAVKCLKKDVVLEDNDVECTLIERKVLSLGTKHPYLCHLFCTFQTPSHLFFVMEYLTGGDLMFHIQHCGRFDEFRACFYAAEITSGLKFLHSKGIIYRDLKLDNILLDYQGHIRIADFGMCKLQVYLDRYADTFCGTPDYMAPEVIKGQHYNQCVDWWSFGVLLYEMLTGKSPFKGCDEDHLFWLICNDEPFFPKFLSLEATEILKGLLDKDSSRRLGIPFSPYGEIKDHAFFKYIDWCKIERKEVETPYKPKLRHILDVHYFDKLFTKRQAAITPLDESILATMDQTAFTDFSYTNPNITD